MLLKALLSITIFQGIIISLIILKSPLFKTKTNTYLAYVIVSLSIILFNYLAELSNLYISAPFLKFLDSGEWIFLLPVFLFLFIVHFVNHPIKDSKKRYLLYIPFFFSYIINLPLDISQTFSFFKISKTITIILELLNLLNLLTLFVFLPWLLFYSISFLKPNKNPQEKRWIIFLWSLIFIFLISFIILFWTGLFTNFELEYYLSYVAFIVTFFIHWIAYSGIYKFKLAKDKEGINQLLNKKITPPSVTESVYIEKNTPIPPLTVDNPYFKKLASLCENQQIYRDSDLSRDKIADELGISSGYVSQLVNTITGKNFANYINDYRVKAVKKMVLDSEFDKYSLLAIGLEAGFNSKTTFYNTFKKHTGMTPSQYRKTNS